MGSGRNQGDNNSSLKKKKMTIIQYHCTISFTLEKGTAKKQK